MVIYVGHTMVLHGWEQSTMVIYVGHTMVLHKSPLLTTPMDGSIVSHTMVLPSIYDHSGHHIVDCSHPCRPYGLHGWE